MRNIRETLDAAVTAAADLAAALAEAPLPRRATTFLTVHWDAARWRRRLAAFGDGSRINPHVVIHGPDRVHVGADVHIAEFVHVWGGGGVTIGDHVRIAAHATITSQTHDTTAERFGDTRVVAPVHIADRAWIGSNAVILPGVTVGEGAIVGAGSVVTKDVPAGTTVVGIPARPL